MRRNQGEEGQPQSGAQASANSARLTDSRRANLGANAIWLAFTSYQEQFRIITCRAKKRFEEQDWQGMQSDSRARLELYRERVDETVTEVENLLADRVGERMVWASMKAVFSSLIVARDDWELAETFFNSITRRIFATVGVDPQIEFVDTDYDTPPNQSPATVYDIYDRADSTAELIEAILTAQQFATPFQDLARDARLVAQEIERHLRRIGALRVVERTEMVHSIFYRGKGAYLVGRLFSGSHQLPLVLAVLHGQDGLMVDAVLLEEDATSILFSFTRSYFHVDVARPYDLIRFLKTIMPRKRIAELYISIGYNKHGKTELYRDILYHLAYSQDKFEVARGKRGMVMTVFTMPAYDLVFKVIKDRFAEPKATTRDRVMGKYDLVFRHDRAGRLVDAQEFEHLQFARERFAETLLQELQDDASNTVEVGEEYGIIHHAYVERRIIPLDIYIAEADEESAVATIIDYGNAIKDMAVSNIFPGDMLLKNFGVTRHGRVVFYDYDELCLLSECNFRKIPPARSYEDELSPQPWFSVAENDIFPEQFSNFLGIGPELREVFMTEHADLLQVDFWRRTQARLAAGEIISVMPYRADQRLGKRSPAES